MPATSEATEAAQPTDWPGYEKFSQVQDLLDRNTLLIAQINENHSTRTPEALQRNVGLVKELNSNVAKVVELYKELADSFLAAPGPEGAPPAATA